MARHGVSADAGIACQGSGPRYGRSGRRLNWAPEGTPRSGGSLLKTALRPEREESQIFGALRVSQVTGNLGGPAAGPVLTASSDRQVVMISSSPAGPRRAILSAASIAVTVMGLVAALALHVGVDRKLSAMEHTLTPAAVPSPPCDPLVRARVDDAVA